MVLYTFVRNDNGYLNSPYLNCNVKVPYVNWYNLDNQWNDNEPGLREQIFLFLLCFYNRGVLFWNLTIPTTKHFSNLF